MSPNSVRVSVRTAFLVALLSLAGVAAAAADPPARVGRLSFIEGTVSYHTYDQDQWSPATRNYPVTTGDSFYTDTNSRAVIEVGAASLRLDQQTAADVARLDDQATQIELDQGAINLRLWSLPPGGVSVLTPLGQVDLVAPGIYDINAGQPDGDAPPSQVQVTVLQGAAHLDQPAADLQTGQSAVIAGNPPTVSLVQAEPSAFDNWAAVRDRHITAARPRYVSPQMTGYEDLETSGQWASDPNYGEVWYPSAVPADWAPYRYGHWAYVAPWGWTWIDEAPWGFAPFHYGRWAYFGNRWGWVPGAVTAQPVYAPALVAFVGDNGWGVTLGAGAAIAAIGWVALAPREVYHPYYPASVNYVRQVNVAYVNRTVINNITVNNYRREPARVASFRNYQRATTVVPAGAFTHAAPVAHAAVRVAPQALARAQVRPSLASFKPTARARAGVADPAAATAYVARPNMAAKIATHPVTASAAVPRALAAQTVPKAPGPKVQPRSGAERRGFRPIPASAPATTPRPAAAPDAGAARGQPQRAAPSSRAAPPAAGQREAPAREAPARNQARPETPRSAPSVHVLPPPGAAGRTPAETRRTSPAARPATVRTPEPARREASPSPAARPAAVRPPEPARREASPSPAARPAAVRPPEPARREASPAPAGRPAAVRPPEPAHREAPPAPAARPATRPPEPASREAPPAPAARPAARPPEPARREAPPAPAARPAAVRPPEPARREAPPHPAPAPHPAAAPPRPAPAPHPAAAPPRPAPAPHPAAAPPHPAPAAQPAPAPASPKEQKKPDEK